MGQNGIGERIRTKALQIIMSRPNGIRYADLLDRVQRALHCNPNTVAGKIWDLDRQMPGKVYKPERGLFKPRGRARREYREETGQSAESGKVARIRATATEIIRSKPEGIRYTELKRQIRESLGYNPNTIGGSIYDLDRRMPDAVYKPERGVFKPKGQARLGVRREGRSTAESQPGGQGLSEQFEQRFDGAIRNEAQRMAEPYTLFYCLERSVRRLVGDTLERIHGQTWWDGYVPQTVRDNAKAAQQREMDSEIEPRSSAAIDYVTFGELCTIVEHNWVDFSSLISNMKAFKKIASTLNALRNPIAHCCPVPDTEFTRLRLAVTDWLRLTSKSGGT